MKLLLVTSPGGHFHHAYELRHWWSQYDRVWATRNDPTTKYQLKNEKVYFAHFPEQRSFLNAIKNFFLALQIIRREKPDVVFSIGAGIAPPFFLAAWLLRIPTIFMEIFVFIPQPTLSGKMVYLFSNLFLVQNKEMLKTYPKAKYWGSCL